MFFFFFDVAMHEFGIGVTGTNEVRGTALNPHDLTRHTGGSSSGAGAAVSANLVPIVVGGDGGGSIRIPSALCGVYGLKITAARVVDADHGVAWTVGVLGPMATNVHDLAVAYSLMTTPIAEERLGNNPLGSLQPPAHASWEREEEYAARPPLVGLRVCTIRKYNAMGHDREVMEAVDAAVEEMTRLGATLLDESQAKLAIPRLGTILRAHSLTILAEMSTQTDGLFAQATSKMTRESVISLSIARSLTARDYLAAQKIRSWAMRHFSSTIFSQCDLLVSPSTGSLAPKISGEAALREGETDAGRVFRIMKFSQLANFLGFPSGVMPFGFVRREGGVHLPTSVQISASHWNEHLILRAMKALEDVVVREKKAWPRRPAVAGEASV